MKAGTLGTLTMGTMTAPRTGTLYIGTIGGTMNGAISGTLA